MHEPDREMADVLARQVRLPDSARYGTSSLVGATAFALNGEEPLFSLFRPPQVTRQESGEARLLALTGKRVVEVTATLSGEWGLTVCNDHGRDVEVRVTSLSAFTRITVRGGHWLHDERTHASHVLSDSSAALSGVGESLWLWEEGDPSLTRVDEDALLRGLGVIARAIGHPQELATE